MSLWVTRVLEWEKNVGSGPMWIACYAENERGAEEWVRRRVGEGSEVDGPFLWAGDDLCSLLRCVGRGGRIVTRCDLTGKACGGMPFE